MIKSLRTWLLLVLLGGLCLRPFSLPGQQSSGSAAAAIRYTVSLDGFQDHLLRVRMELPPGDALRQIQLPVWNALYQVRDFSQHVNKVAATGRGGDALSVQKTDKTTWQFDGARDGAAVEYQVYADQPGPYGAQVNAAHAFFNLAEILMYPEGGRSAEMRVRFTNVPAGWKFATPLTSAGDEFAAANYDQLVDSPATTTWRGSLGMRTASSRRRLRGWTIVPFSTICFFITSHAGRVGEGWSTHIPRPSS